MQNIKYISEFFSKKCAQDLLPFFIGCRKRAAKEVTESLGCYYACDKMDVGNSVVISVGDGKYPRTASVFAFLSGAETHSVDPNLSLDWFNNTLPTLHNIKPQRMNLHPKPDTEVKIDCGGKNCILVGCHSHSHLKNSVQVPFNYAKLSIVWMPCCVNVPPNFLTKKVSEESGLRYYVDSNIWSPKNCMYIWENFKEI